METQQQQQTYQQEAGRQPLKMGSPSLTLFLIVGILCFRIKRINSI